jgi:hypothetical protein
MKTLLFLLLNLLPMSKDLTYEQAKKLAIFEMEIIANHDHDIILWEEKTQQKPHYWVFLFSTQKHIETDNPNYSIPGLPMLIVETDGTITKTPSSVSPSLFFEHFDKQIAVKYKKKTKKK